MLRPGQRRHRAGRAKRAASGITALHSVLNEWRQPTYDFGDLPTLWRLYNAFTTILADRAQRNPQRHAALTIDLKDLIESHFPKMKALELKAAEVDHANAA